MEIFKLFGSIFVDNAKADKSIDETDKKGKGLSQTFGGMGKAAKVMGGLIVAGVGAAVTAVGGLVLAGDNLQKALNTLQTQTGATKDEMKGMEESLINIYKNNYGESFDDIAESMANVKQVTGLTGDALEDATTKALLMRDTFGFEVNESVRTVSVMMKNFGITSKEAFTLLAQGQQMGVNASDDMLDTFLEYSPLFKQLGFDAEAMLNILNDGMKNGVRNSDVLADAVKEFGIRVKDGSKTSSEAFAGLGLNANKMAQEFAKGGDSAQSAFEKTMAALGKIEDPVKRNTIGVSLFGTKFEDLEYQAILSLGNVEKVADKSGKTLEDIDKIKYNTIGEAIAGIWRAFSGNVLIPIEQKLMPTINDSINRIKDMIPGVVELFKGNSLPLIEYITKHFSKESQLPIINFFLSLREGAEKVQEYLGKANEVVDAFFAAFSGNKGGAISMLSRAGLSSDQIQLFLQAVDTVKSYLNNLSVYWTNVWSGIKYVVSELWNFLGPLIMPALSAIVSFIQEKLALVKQFWNENGKQIVEAARNAFQFILAMVQFFMPVVLFLIQSIWENIKGVISGALSIIMGLLKIFAGLFTGDFSKMWEGIKQLFFGALEFLWNLFSLLMIGKLLGGIKAFISGGLGLFKNFGTTAVNTFKSFFDSIITWFQYFRATGSSIWQATIAVFKNLITMFVQAAKSNFNSILNTAKSVFNGVKDAILHPIQTAKNTIKGIIAEIKGFFSGLKLKLPDIKMPHFKIKNWSKNPLDWLKAMPSLAVDWYAKGTNYAPGGLAVVGEYGPELINLPRGSQVKTASETRSILSKNNESKQPAIIQIVTPDKREIARWIVDDVTEIQEYNLYNAKLFRGRL